jgi:hypothetical protein
MTKKEIEMSRFHEIELEKSYGLIQTLENLRIQVGIFFATVNLSTLSFGVSQEKAIFFFFAALLFWVMVVIDLAIRGMLTHAYYRVTYLHKLYVKGDITFSPHTNSRLAGEVVKITNMKDSNEQLNALKHLPSRVRNLYGFWLPIIASFVEIVAGLLLWNQLGWSLI